MTLTLAPASRPATPRPASTRPVAAWDWLLWLIAEEVQVRDEVLLLQGRPWPAPPEAGGAGAVLPTLLYQRYYLGCRGWSPTDATAVDRRPVFAREDPVTGRALREGTAGRWVWEGGWRPTGVRTLAGDGYAKDDLLLQVGPEEVRLVDGEPQVRFPAGRPFASPGFFAVVGARGGPGPGRGTLRCYLNLRPDRAVPAFLGLTAALDAIDLPYTAKVLNHPESFPRPDSAVVYLPRAESARGLERLLSALRAGPSSLQEGAPAFTRPLTPGLAVADEPESDRPVSFGQHRCRILAGALLQAAATAGARGRRRAMDAALLAAGLDVERLHLNPGASEVSLPACLGGAPC